MSHPIEVPTPGFGITDHSFSIFVGMANKDPALPVLTAATQASVAIVTHCRQRDSSEGIRDWSAEGRTISVCVVR
jgi:hypothetical protein